MKNHLFSLLLSISHLGALMAMEPSTLSLKEALELAVEFGISNKSVPGLTEDFLKKAIFTDTRITISRCDADDLISAALIEQDQAPEPQVAADDLSSVKENGDSASEVDSFAQEFDAQFAKFVALRAEARRLGNKYGAAAKLKEMTRLQNNLDADLIKRSKNKWFLTGNFLNFKLRLKEVPLYETEQGPLILHAFKTKAPLYHLVSHHQIFNSCGFNALANAHAIERQVQEKRSITSACTRAYAEHCFVSKIALSEVFKSLVIPDGIDFSYAEQIQNAAHNLDLPLHLIFLCSEELRAFHDDSSKLPIIELIKNNPAVHFIITVGRNHWVLASVVHDAQGIALHYLDSANNQMNEKQIGEVITYIDELIGSAQ